MKVAESRARLIRITITEPVCPSIVFVLVERARRFSLFYKNRFQMGFHFNTTNLRVLFQLNNLSLE